MLVAAGVPNVPYTPGWPYPRSDLMSIVLLPPIQVHSSARYCLNFALAGFEGKWRDWEGGFEKN